MSFGRDIGSAIGGAFAAMVAAAFVLGGALAVALIYGVPWLWGLVKPWLHSVTAT